MARIPGLVLAEFETSLGHRMVAFEGDDGKMWMALASSLRDADEKSKRIPQASPGPKPKRW